MTELYPSQADTQFQQRPLTLDYLKQDIDERIRRIRVLLGMLPSDGYHPQRLLQDKLENKSQYIQADFVQENALREITSVRNTLSPLASPDKLSSKYSFTKVPKLSYIRADKYNKSPCIRLHYIHSGNTSRYKTYEDEFHLRIPNKVANILYSYEFTLREDYKKSPTSENYVLIEKSPPKEIIKCHYFTLNLSGISPKMGINSKSESRVMRTEVPVKSNRVNQADVEKELISIFSVRGENVKEARKSIYSIKPKTIGTKARMTITKYCIAVAEYKVNKNLNKKRKYSIDNKLRLNIIKKIYDKYGKQGSNC